MKYKRFDCIKDAPNWKVIIEYENNKITELHYFNVKTLETTDIVLLKKVVDICGDFDYLCFNTYIKGNIVHYLYDIYLTNGNRWNYTNKKFCSSLNLNMDENENY